MRETVFTHIRLPKRDDVTEDEYNQFVHPKKEQVRKRRKRQAKLKAIR